MRSTRLGAALLAAGVLALAAPAARAQLFRGSGIYNLSPPAVVVPGAQYWGFAPMAGYWGGPAASIFGNPYGYGYGYPTQGMDNLTWATPTSNLLTGPPPDTTGSYPVPTGSATTGQGVTPTSGTALAGYGPANPVGMGAIPRTSDTVDARFEPSNRLFVRWAGDAGMVQRVTFALLDSKRNVLVRKTIDKLPAEAHMQLTNRTAYYQVLVEYVNGTTSSFVSPI